MINVPEYHVAEAQDTLPPAVEQASADRRVWKTITWMQENLSRQISLADMAKVVNLSVWRFCHVFKRETGVTPLQYLKALRLERAKRLLEETFLSVKQVMIEVGINDESHFVRDFKAAYELPPTKFRRRYSPPAEGRGLPKETRAAEGTREGVAATACPAVARGKNHRGAAKSANK